MDSAGVCKFATVMQFLGEDTESVTIYKLLNQTMAKPLSLTTNEWISILVDIAEALFHVHNKGFLHCDVKSNNVLVAGKKGFLIDFGKKLANFPGQQLESTLPFTTILPLRFSEVFLLVHLLTSFHLGSLYVMLGRNCQMHVWNP